MTNRPTGYVYDQSIIDSNVAAFSAAGVDLQSPFASSAQRLIDSGITYMNLVDNEVEFLASNRSGYTKTGRKLTDAGSFQPVSQRTGICVGCGFSTAQWLAWVSRYVNSGDCEIPQEVSLIAPYLLGRNGLRGDSGAYPSYSARASHDFGVLAVDDFAKTTRREPYTIDTELQESAAESRRDNAAMERAWIEVMANRKTRVYQPKEMMGIADCIANLYPVTVGMGYQITESTPHTSGISSFYKLNGGHETCITGWFTSGGQLHFIKSESWGDFPGSNWTDKRVTVNVDGRGPIKLYVGQGACKALDLWYYRGEYWAIGYVGSV